MKLRNKTEKQKNPQSILNLKELKTLASYDNFKKIYTEVII